MRYYIQRYKSNRRASIYVHGTVSLSRPGFMEACWFKSGHRSCFIGELPVVVCLSLRAPDLTQ